MDSRKFQILQSSRKHRHDLARAERSAQILRHKRNVPIEKRMEEKRPMVEHIEPKAREVEKKGFFKRLFSRKT